MALNLIPMMYAYQKRHGIKKKCIDNTQFALDSFKATHPTLNVKAAAVFMTSWDERAGRMKVWGGHLVLLLDDEDVVDPSYETGTAPQRRYYTSVSALLAEQPVLKEEKEFMRETIQMFLSFSKYAKQMNEGVLLVTDKTYYNAQADYLKQKLGAEVESVPNGRKAPPPKAG